MVSGGMACIKYILFAFNFAFAICGVACIAVGGWIVAQYKGYSNFVDNWFYAAPIIILVVGIIVFLVSFFGCCGAVKENHCMIITFSVLLLVILALEVGAGISGYMMRRNIGTMLQQRMNNTLHEYETNDDVKNSWDVMQHDLGCCGINSSSDWWPKPYKHPRLPLSCCHEVPATKECEYNAVGAFNEGCMIKLKAKFEGNALKIGIAVLVMAFIQLVGVFFACCLARSIRREYETVETTAH